jgi:16S rRNA processing protein RimM
VTAPRLIMVAKVDGAFGVRGEIRLTAFTEDPGALLRYGNLRREDGRVGLTLSAGRVVKDSVVARAAEVATREEAQALRGLRLYVDRAMLPAPEDDEYYLADLMGLAAVSPQGAVLGRIKTVNNFGAGDLLEIQPANGSPSWWSPFTREAVPEVRLDLGELVVVRLPETSAEPDTPAPNASSRKKRSGDAGPR